MISLGVVIAVVATQPPPSNIFKAGTIPSETVYVRVTECMVDVLREQPQLTEAMRLMSCGCLLDAELVRGGGDHITLDDITTCSNSAGARWKAAKKPKLISVTAELHRNAKNVIEPRAVSSEAVYVRVALCVEGQRSASAEFSEAFRLTNCGCFVDASYARGESPKVTTADIAACANHAASIHGVPEKYRQQ